MGKPKVFFVRGTRNESVERLKQIAQVFYGLIQAPENMFESSAVIKTHVGEIDLDGTDLKTHTRPELVDAFGEVLRKHNAIDVVAADSLPTYTFGHRKTVDGHIRVATAHGFINDRIKTPFVVADAKGVKTLDNDRLGKVHIPQLFYDYAKAAGYVLMLTHFTGHELLVYGGALKNMGMGLVGKETKARIHGFKATVDLEKCIGCGECAPACSYEAISYVDGPEHKLATVDIDKCLGCMGCLPSCGEHALGLDFKRLGDDDSAAGRAIYATDSLIEGSYEAGKIWEPRHMFFGTDLTGITVFCDCDTQVLHKLQEGGGQQFLCKDIGYLASTDPVALDQACIDLVQQQMMLEGAENPVERWHKLCHVMPNYFRRALTRQVERAVELGMGQKEYELVTVQLH